MSCLIAVLLAAVCGTVLGARFPDEVGGAVGRVGLGMKRLIGAIKTALGRAA